MISASHNPYQFNGIKIFGGEGFKLPDALEDQIEALVLDEAAIPLVGGDRLGQITHSTTAVRDYVEHLKATVPYSLDGMKVAVDCANGSASATARLLFEELGADAVLLSETPDGVNINTNCGSTHMEALQAYVKEHPDVVAGVAFDGDADRCLFVDEAGEVVDGDFIMAICGLDLARRGKLRRNTIVGTVLTNMGFSRFCEENGLKFAATKVGDRYVLEEMELEGYVLGGEQSGHVIFRDFATTGDGQLTAAQLLSILKQREAKLSSLKTVMERYPQTMVNIKVSPEGKLAFHTDPKVKKAIQQATATLNGEGRVIVRPSGTEPLLRVMVEGRDLTLIEKLANDISEVIKEELV